MIPAANTSQRIGYLLTNPGGPGIADIQLGGQGDLGDTVTGRYWRSTQLHQYFDIVGPDPRGVALSSPLECDPDLWNTASHISLFPNDESSYNELVNAWRAAGKSCAKMSGERLNHVDTASVAKDFEAIRIALGDEPMNYLGFSYGTQIGLQYAELYPHNIRAMALDSVLDHTQDEIYFLETESSGYEATLNQFFLWCAKNTSCAYHNTTDFPAKFDHYITAANNAPIPAPQCSNTSFQFYPCKSSVTGYDILAFLRTLLVSFNPENGLGIPSLVTTSYLLELAFAGHDASYFSLANTTSPISTDYPSTAVSCQDHLRSNISWSEFQTKMNMARIISPHTRGQGEFWQDQIRCQNWPAPVVNPPRSIAPAFRDLSLKIPVLLVNAFYDPETAYPYSVNVQREFGERNAVLLSRNGSGHTSWYFKGDTHFAINDYLIGLEVPQPATILQS